MLTLTENAVMVIRDLAAQQGEPQDAGIRISADQTDGTLSLQPAAQPEQGDQVVENLGARAFLDKDSAQLLDDKALDAGVDDEGAVHFAIVNLPH